MGLTEKDLEKILKAIEKAYEQAGKKIKTATLTKPKSEGEEMETEIVIDNRKPEDNN